MFLFIFIEIILVMMFVAPNLFSIKTYIITSASMEPKLPVGSLIYVKNVDFKSLKKGDSITFYLNDSKIIATHEILEINKEEENFITYGINNKDENNEIVKDAVPVEYSDVIGKVILCIPYLGFINKFITSIPGIFIIGILTIFIIFFDNMKKKVVKKYE